MEEPLPNSFFSASVRDLIARIAGAGWKGAAKWEKCTDISKSFTGHNQMTLNDTPLTYDLSEASINMNRWPDGAPHVRTHTLALINQWQGVLHL